MYDWTLLLFTQSLSESTLCIINFCGRTDLPICAKNFVKKVCRSISLKHNSIKFIETLNLRSKFRNSIVKSNIIEHVSTIITRI